MKRRNFSRNKEDGMDRKILVAYASKYGATAEIAGKIGEVLCQAGLQVEVIPVDQVRNVNPYRAVILGSALYIDKWLKGAETFVKVNEKGLSQRPVWIFSSGPTDKGDPIKLVAGKRLPSAMEPVVERIRPRDIAVFHGYNNLEKMNWIEKFAIRSIVKKSFGDFRDWDMIAKWAEQIASALKGVE
jgi:menaquinone-dependent protoporphyrinogen oxidase